VAIDDAARRAEELGATLTERQAARLVDLRLCGQLAASLDGEPEAAAEVFSGLAGIWNSDDALRQYLRLRPDPSGQPIEKEDTADRNAAAGPATEAAGRLLSTENVWVADPGVSAFHREIWELLASEVGLLAREGDKAKASGLAVILVDLAQGLRKVLLRTDLAPRLKRHSGGVSKALHSMSVAHRPDGSMPKETPWSRTKAFLFALVDAEGSINRKIPASSKRQSLWRGVFLLEPWLVGELNGSVPPETRVNRCAAFNSALVPDILVCTAIGSEGIDLHTQCAEVIHHDLPWNPAKLEQRTGRIDRVGSLTENAEHLRLHIGIPFLAHNYEKFQYDLVVRRAQKFEVLLGKPEFVTDVPDEEELDKEGNETGLRENVEGGVGVVDREAYLPRQIIEYLKMDLSV